MDISIRSWRGLLAAGLLVGAVSATPLLSNAAGTAALVKTSAAQMLVNAKGMTLYVFALDKPGKSACYGQCARYWPPLLVPAGVTVPATMAGLSGKWSVARRTDGTRQLAYEGAPLYTFAMDKKPGDMNGQGVLSSWWVVVAAKAAATAAAPAPPTATAASPAAATPTVAPTPYSAGY